MSEWWSGGGSNLGFRIDEICRMAVVVVVVVEEVYGLSLDGLGSGEEEEEEEWRGGGKI